MPCVAKDSTIAVLAVGRRPHGEPLNSEDLVLVSAVAGQAATAIENARLYGELHGKANEIERLRQFGDSVVESLSDGLVVVDLDDRVLRWNRRVESLTGIDARSRDGAADPRAVQPASSSTRCSPRGASRRAARSSTACR